jgi:hemerythrin-like domain-containing protein
MRLMMSEAMNRLQREHKNIAKLLDALEHQLALFDAAEAPDYDIVAGIARYFTGFPERCHHPKEDLIFRKLQARDPEAARSVGDLEAEHEKIGDLARHFQEAVDNVLSEVEVSRQAFDAVARHFIEEQRRHMRMEEERFFPLARERLTPEDWAEIDARIVDEDDPLFGAEVSAEFAALRKDLLRWEEEDERKEDD